MSAYFRRARCIQVDALGEMLTVVLGDRANLEGKRFEERFHLRTEPAQVLYVLSRLRSSRKRRLAGHGLDDLRGGFSLLEVGHPSCANR